MKLKVLALLVILASVLMVGTASGKILGGVWLEGTMLNDVLIVDVKIGEKFKDVSSVQFELAVSSNNVELIDTSLGSSLAGKDVFLVMPKPDNQLFGAALLNNGFVSGPGSLVSNRYGLGSGVNSVSVSAENVLFLDENQEPLDYVINDLVVDVVNSENNGNVFLDASVIDGVSGSLVKLRYLSYGVANVGGAELKLDYDKSKLKYSNFVPGNVFTGDNNENQYFYVEPKEDENGDLLVGMVSLNKVNDISSGSFVDLLFEILPGEIGGVDFIANDAMVISVENEVLFEGELSTSVVLPGTGVDNGVLFLDSGIVGEGTKRILELKYKIENMEKFKVLESTLFYDGVKLDYMESVIGSVVTGDSGNNQYLYESPVELENDENTLKFKIDIVNKNEVVVSGDVVVFRFEIVEEGSIDFTTKNTVVSSENGIIFNEELVENVQIAVEDDSDGDGVPDYKDKCNNFAIKTNGKQYTINNVGCPLIFYDENRIDQLKDLSNQNLREPVRNLFVGRRNIGKVQFIDDVSLINENNELIDLEEGITIEPGIVRIEDPRLEGKSAIIEIVVPGLLDLDNIVVNRKDDSGNIVRCDSGDVPSCTIVGKKHVDTNDDGLIDSTSISFEVYSL